MAQGQGRLLESLKFVNYLHELCYSRCLICTCIACEQIRKHLTDTVEAYVKRPVITGREPEQSDLPADRGIIGEDRDTPAPAVASDVPGSGEVISTWAILLMDSELFSVIVTLSVIIFCLLTLMTLFCICVFRKTVELTESALTRK